MKGLAKLDIVSRLQKGLGFTEGMKMQAAAHVRK